MKNEVPMLQRIRVTLQRRINLIHRLDRISFIAPSSEGTMVQLQEMKEFWEWMIEEEKAMILMIGLWRTKKGWHQIRRHLNGLSHPMLGISSHGNDQQTDIIEIEVCVKSVFVYMNPIEHISSLEEVFFIYSFTNINQKLRRRKWWFEYFIFWNRWEW